MIKLEKGACSYTNRSIMSKGAFAVLYGQRLKCYIRDPEVVLSIIFLSSKYDTPKIKKKLQDILDLDCPNFLSFNLQIDKYYIMRTFDWPHGKSIIRIIMRTFLNSMTSIILLLEFIVKLVCSYYRCANVQIGRATYSCTKGIININYPWMYSLLWNLKCLGISICFQMLFVSRDIT